MAFGIIFSIGPKLFFYLQRVFLPVEQLVGKYPSPPIYHRGAENLIQDTLLLREYGIYGEVQQDTKMFVIPPISVENSNLIYPVYLGK